MNPDRRVLLGIGIGGVAGLLVGVPFVLRQGAAQTAALQHGGTFHTWLHIPPDGRICLTLTKAEMGQGISTAFAQLVAEELEVNPHDIDVVHAPADDARFGDAAFGGLQMTGGSTSVRGSWKAMRQAGATARAMLLSAGAALWGTDRTRLSAHEGRIHNSATGASASYGELASQAARLQRPAAVSLKPLDALRIVGHPQRRLDGAGKVDGSATFGIDAAPKGMLCAAVAASPVPGGRVAAMNRAAGLAVPGVRQVFDMGDLVAVVADRYWTARKALAALDVQWNDGALGQLDSAALAFQLASDAVSGPLGIAAATGPSLPAGTVSVREATYSAPLLAHATMEPMNCTVQVQPGRVDIWVGTQVPTLAQRAAARVTGVPASQVHVHNHLLGGGFGRRLEVDFVEQAARIAMRVEAPLKVIWSREEDMQHDMYRPAYHDRIAATLDAQGLPSAWHHRITGSSIIARFFPPLFRDGVDADAVEGARELPYALPAMRVEFVRSETPGLRTAFWRGVGPTRNAFVVESFLDELAKASGRDPVAYRLALVRDPRARRVLQLAAARARWGSPLDPVAGARRGRGVALIHAFGSYVAQVAKVRVADDGAVRIESVHCVVDCGLAVNPLTVAAQMEGGIVFGLGAALWGEITLAKGRVVQSNFHDYQVARITDTPLIDVHIVPSREEPGGVGEPGTSAVIPAIANAVQSATGVRVRRLPVANQAARTT